MADTSTSTSVFGFTELPHPSFLPTLQQRCGLHDATKNCLLHCRMNSGAGALISRGMMEKLPLTFMEKCIFDIKQARGNACSYQICVNTSAIYNAIIESLAKLV